MVIILAVFYKIAKTVFGINLCGLSCFSLWFELTMCLCSLNQALSFGNTKIDKSIPLICLVKVIAISMLEILRNLLYIKISYHSDCTMILIDFNTL